MGVVIVSESEKAVIEHYVDPNWSIYAAPLVNILQVAEQLGVSREALLSHTTINPESLHIPDRRFPVSDYFKLYQAAADATENPDIGLAVGRITFLKGMNLQLYMAKVSTQFRDYLNVIPSLLKLRGDIGQISAYRDEGLIELRWEPLSLNTGRKRFFSDEVLAAATAIINSLCVLPVPVVKAHFTYVQPRERTLLEAVFGRNLAFEQTHSSLFFQSSALNYPLLEQDYYQGPDGSQPFQNFFGKDDPADPLLLRLKQSILQHLPEGEVTIDKMAGKLNVSRRTLQRRLADRETNFLHILQEVRAGVALRYLSDSRLSITEIAFLLGYADQGSFSSAFKSWQGVSPREYRRS